MNNEIILVGAFGEMCELAEMCGKIVIGIIDNNILGSFRGIPIIGTDDNATELYCKYSSTPIVISPDCPQIRKKLVIYYQKIGFRFCSLISPLASVSPTAKIGQGSVVQSRCNISSDTIIGDFCKINTLSNIMHDNEIGSFTTIAPNAVLLGRVRIEECAYIGANSTLLPAKKVGANSIIGAGAVVTKDIPDNVVAKGIPADYCTKCLGGVNY